MTNRYPLVVNATTNQITEVQSGDNLLLDNTDLTTSSGDLVLDPFGDVDIKADLKNTADPNLKVDDDLYVTGLLVLVLHQYLTLISKSRELGIILQLHSLVQTLTSPTQTLMLILDSLDLLMLM